MNRRTGCDRRELRRSPRRLPLCFRLASTVGGRLVQLLSDRFDDRAWVVARRHDDVKLVPEPAARRREVEVVAFDRETVRERDAASRRMARFAPRAGLEQHGVEEPQLDYLACNP